MIRPERTLRTAPSPQSRGARNRSAAAKLLAKGLTGADTNFLLTCSDSTLASYELARLGAVANLRSQLFEILDQLIDTGIQAGIANWFRNTDLTALRRAIENPLDVQAWAQAQIRDGQRSEEELVPSPSLPSGQAHLAAALRYQERNIAEGKCAICPESLDPNSVRYCTKHLAAARGRHKPKDGKDEAPGSISYLYQDHAPESRHGRAPGNLARLAMHRENKTRALLAELGIPSESAAVSLKAAKDALLKVMPESKARATPMAELFDAAVVPSRTTGQKALNELLSEGKIQRTGKGGMRDVFRYFEKRGEK
jgi:hypothetical protein